MSRALIDTAVYQGSLVTMLLENQTREGDGLWCVMRPHPMPKGYHLVAFNMYNLSHHPVTLRTCPLDMLL